MVTLVVVLLLILGAGGGLTGVYLSQRPDSDPVATDDETPLPTPTRSPTPPVLPDPTTPPTPNADTATIGLVDVSAVRADSRAADVGAVLNEYFTGINTRDMPRVLAVMDPSGVVNRDNPQQVERFRIDVSTTTDTNIVLHWVRDDGVGGVLAGVTFTSRQDAQYGPDGEACTNWSLTYTLSSQFLIVRTTGTHQIC
jgi:hypothetical protein